MRKEMGRGFRQIKKGKSPEGLSDIVLDKIYWHYYLRKGTFPVIFERLFQEKFYRHMAEHPELYKR